MNKSYHNTTNESGQTLMTFEQECKGQEQLIKDFFKAHPYPKMYTPFEVHKYIPELTASPVTSIRRAMTNLSKERTNGEGSPIPAYLHKSDVKVIERYGKPNCKWFYQS